MSPTETALALWQRLVAFSHTNVGIAVLGTIAAVFIWHHFFPD